MKHKWLPVAVLALLLPANTYANVWDDYVSRLMFNVDLSNNKDTLIQRLKAIPTLKLLHPDYGDTAYESSKYFSEHETVFEFDQYPLFDFSFKRGIIKVSYYPLVDTMGLFFPDTEVYSRLISVDLSFNTKDEMEAAYSKLVERTRTYSDNKDAAIDRSGDWGGTHVDNPMASVVFQNTSAGTIHYLNLLNSEPIKFGSSSNVYDIHIDFYGDKPHWLHN